MNCFSLFVLQKKFAAIRYYSIQIECQIKKGITMRYLIQSVVVAFLIIAISGCAGWSGHKANKEAPAEKVKISQVPSPARTTIYKLTVGGEIRSIEKETKNGQDIYDVEATVGGKDVEYDVAANGEILTSEKSVPFDSLPAKVKAAAEKYFGSAKGLKASKEMEKGKASYEIEGSKAGSKATLKISDKGQILEEEK
jgi:uncharacterized membrane protein YkoI